MALASVTIEKYDVKGTERANRVLIAFGAGYPTNGEPITAKQCGMSAVKSMSIEREGLHDYEFDRAAMKVKVITGAGAEVANASNQTGRIARATVYGEW